jgi:membrane-bound ClpP family serine protease
LGLLLAALLLYIIALSRHQKGAGADLRLIGAVGRVETGLEPEGSVLVRGELWPACSKSGRRIERGRTVRVVGAGGHLLKVEPVE